MVSPWLSGKRLTIGIPFAVRSRSGISSPRRRYTLPRLEKNSKYECDVVKITLLTMSSDFILAPLTPRPPRPWVRNESADTALMYCACVITMTSSLLSTKSSTLISPTSAAILHTRGVANASRTAVSSLEMTARNLVSELRIDSSSLILASTSFCSVSRSIRDNLVSWRNCISRMSIA